VRAAVVAPEPEGSRWFVFGRGPPEALIAAGRSRRVAGGPVSWLVARSPRPSGVRR